MLLDLFQFSDLFNNRVTCPPKPKVENEGECKERNEKSEKQIGDEQEIFVMKKIIAMMMTG